MSNQQNSPQLYRYVLVGVFGFIVVYAVLFRQHQLKKKNVPAKPEATPEPVETDTFIPHGHVLVPIEIQNAQALNGLIHQFGVVDLYNRDLSGNTWVKIAGPIKLIRAPLDPTQFAVLLPDSEAKELLHLSTPFWVSLKNRSVLKAQTEVLKTINEPALNQTEPRIRRQTQSKQKSRKSPPPKFEIEYQI